MTSPNGRPMAITMGDASGVGPEIVLRLFADGALRNDVVVYGDVAMAHSSAVPVANDSKRGPSDQGSHAFRAIPASTAARHGSTGGMRDFMCSTSRELALMRLIRPSPRALPTVCS